MSDTKVKRDWTAEFNALPNDVRLIGSAMEVQTRIQHLQMERERLAQAYRRSLDKVDCHIRNCEKWLKELEEPTP